MSASFDIVDLKSRPDHFELICERIWRTWWEPDGLARDAVEVALGAVVQADGFPFTLVAEREGVFAGTVTAIQTDIASHPELGPCIAALWVEPAHRGQGLGGNLLQSALERLIGQGHTKAYLCAKPRLRPFYGACGWILMIEEADAEGLDIYRSPEFGG
jgi:predicted N-acetyltransferase YhbS